MGEKSTVRRCVLLGASGHAKMLIECLGFSADVELVGLLEADTNLHGSLVGGVPVLGDDGKLPELAAAGVEFFAVAVGCVDTGGAARRRRLFELAASHGLRPLTVAHPSAIVAVSAAVAEGAQLMPGCLVNANAEIGANAIINSGALVEHDCVVGAHAHVATGVVLGGGVSVGALAHVGIGAVVRQGISIGRGAMVGAGAVVVADVPPDTLVYGVPAKPISRKE